MKTLEDQFQAMALKVREALSEPEVKINYFIFKLEASGRVHDGDLKITVRLSDNEYGGDYISGNSIEPVVMETLRRKGWNMRNAPLSISWQPEASPVAKAPELVVDNDE